MVVEIGLVHPPVGMNVYIINRLAKDVPLTETFKGVMPFLLSDLVRIVLLLFFPVISLYLVHTFKQSRPQGGAVMKAVKPVSSPLAAALALAAAGARARRKSC